MVSRRLHGIVKRVGDGFHLRSLQACLLFIVGEFGQRVFLKYI